MELLVRVCYFVTCQTGDVPDAVRSCSVNWPAPACAYFELSPCFDFRSSSSFGIKR